MVVKAFPWALLVILAGLAYSADSVHLDLRAVLADLVALDDLDPPCQTDSRASSEHFRGLAQSFRRDMGMFLGPGLALEIGLRRGFPIDLRMDCDLHPVHQRPAFSPL